MRKKLVSIILAVLLISSLAFALVACDKGGTGQIPTPADDAYTIVYIGDSIAEALIGPSPLSERDNYGYYALVGRVNGFKYYNHAVSGHKTSTGIVSGDGLLEMLKRDSENAALMRSHLQEADMIHISVLGNNLLQYNLGLLMLEVADPDFEAKYAAKTTLINALEEGSMKGESGVSNGSVYRPMYRDSVEKFDENGKPIPVKFDFPPTYNDICNIVATLKELNPDAKIVFQKVYNPFFEGSKHLSEPVMAKLAEIVDDGRFGAEGQPINTIEQQRKLADYLLGCLNGMLDRYLDEHPDAFTILDAREAFEEVVQHELNQKDGKVDLSEDSFARQLIYKDWTHPSNFGHAIIAGLTQGLLDDMGISSSDAVKNYKEIKIDQVNRLYKNVQGFDADAAVAAIGAAETFFDVTIAYFTAVDGFTPIY